MKNEKWTSTRHGIESWFKENVAVVFVVIVVIVVVMVVIVSLPLGKRFFFNKQRPVFCFSCKKDWNGQQPYLYRV